MKKTKGLVLRQLGTESIIIAESLDLIDFDRLVSLKAPAAYIWESLPDPQNEYFPDFDLETINYLLTTRYDVEEATARKDAEELIAIWLKAGIIIP
ncbi:MAG: PqqD family protein [Muribaculaceae bacterium]|nr:PqqD family protein [Muribaculaceae bacterium]